ncbi:hypothetical protein ACGFNU_00255 [Spirillospora sp. NPDC048911]|uniref:hypothetical protein n=1 Tax=Spirillospora sp. NPDC048911 TaxID=3364527 RepID=UPI00371FDD85
MTVSWEQEQRLTAEEDDVEGLLLAGERALLVDGDLRASREWFHAAHREAAHRANGPAMGRAALGLGGLRLHEHRTTLEAAAIRVRQREALRRIDPQSVLALRLRIRLAGEEDYRTGGHAAALALVEEARDAGDPVPLAEALTLAHLCVMGPEHGALRLRLAQELIDEAAGTGRHFDLLMGLLWQTVDLFLAGEPHALRRMEELRGLLAASDHRMVGYAFRAMEVMVAIRAGRFEEAEALAADCAERGAAAGDVNSTGWYAGQLGTLRWYQGRVGEFAPRFAELVDSAEMSVIDFSSVAGLALAAATAGDTRVAAGALARLRGRDLADLPRSSSWLLTMYCVVETAYLLQDAETAERAYALLTPYAQLPVVASLAITCMGSVQHSLGLAALTAGDVDRAITHLDEAVSANLALGHWPAVTLSRMRLGQALACRDGAHDETARRELALAAQEAAAMGMRLPVAPDEPAPVTAERDTAAHCVRHGRHWRITLGGRTVQVEDCVGMRHLAVLLANPGTDIAAIDLAAGAETPLPGDSAQPILDDQAKRQYRQRLDQLQADIDEYELAGDTVRATAATTERDWLVAELAATAGLAGRTRRFADGAERARIAVGKAIRRALDRVAAADPDLGAELRAAVQTGRHCCYRPA